MVKSKSPRGKGSPGAFAPGFTTEENSDPSPTAKSPPQKRSVDEGSDSKTRKVPPAKKLKVVDIRHTLPTLTSNKVYMTFLHVLALPIEEIWLVYLSKPDGTASFFKVWEMLVQNNPEAALDIYPIIFPHMAGLENEADSRNHLDRARYAR